MSPIWSAARAAASSATGCAEPKRRAGSVVISTTPEGSVTKTVSPLSRQRASSDSNSTLTTTTPSGPFQPSTRWER